MSKVVIEDVKLNRGCGKEKMKPIQVEFVHGCLKREDVNNFKVGAFSDVLNEKEYVAVCESEGLYYMGNTRHTNLTQCLYIGLRNKKTNKIKLVEISKTNLLPVIQEPETTNTVPKDDKSLVFDDSSFVHKFGMLKGQRLFTQNERLKVKAETMKTTLENAAINASVDESNLLPTKADSYEDMLPPRNIDATESSSVYLMEDIISQKHLFDLKKLGKSILSDEFEITEGQFSPYFLLELGRIRCMEKSQKQRLMGALLFTECLITLAKFKGRIIGGVKNLPGNFPDSVKKYAIEHFTSPAQGLKKRNFTQQNRERVIAHVIVLALIIGECSFNFEALTASLKMDSERLEPIVRIVGAHVNRKGTSAIVHLILPLAQPAKKRIASKLKRK